MADTLAPNTNNYKKGGATILFQRSGTSGLVDLGDIPDFSLSPNAQYLEHYTVRSGQRLLDKRTQTQSGFTIKIGQDEFNAANLALVLKANTPSAFSQASGTAATKSIASPVLGAKYDIGAMQITNVSVKVGATAKTLGTDYTLEADIGFIRFLPTGTILSTDSVDITFDKPALTGELVAPLSASGLIEGSIVIIFRNDDGTVWRYDHTKASLAYDGDIAMSGTDYAKASGEITVEPDYTSANIFGKWTLLDAA